MSSASSPCRRRWLAALVLATVGCGAPARTSSPEVATAAAVDDPPPRRRPDPGDACTTAACWRARAEAARVAGIVDVAAARLGRAFVLAPDEAGLRAWVEALVAGGQPRAAHRVLGELAADERARGLASVVAELRRGLPSAGGDRPLTIDPTPAPTLREALVAHAAGDLAAARRAYEAALADGDGAAPQHRVAFAALLQALGDPAAARRAHAQARIDLSEGGASLELIPAERWYTAGVFWLGEQLAVVQHARPIDPGERRQAELISIWPASASERPLRELAFPEVAAVTVATADGGLLLRGVGPRLEVIDPVSGALLRTIRARGGDIRQIVSAGAGAGLHLLVAAGGQAELWRADGEHLGDFPLSGTTPTITRVYRGGGTYHDNILEDSPTWAVSLALAGDARALAIGGSDSKVRLFTRGPGGDRERLLAYAWTYEERRPMGGNPDLNLPLALRFVGGGASLLVAYGHGDLIRWRTRDGARERHVPAACGEAEAIRYANRYTAPGEPQRRPSAEEREGCGRVQRAVIAADGRFVLSSSRGGAGVRVRDGRSGEPRFHALDFEVPQELLAVSPAGRVALANLYGHTATWSEAEGLAIHHRGPADTGPIDPGVSDSGRVLTFDLDGGDRRWDLLRGRPLDADLAADEVLLAVADDGVTRVVRRGESLELRQGSAPPRIVDSLGDGEKVAAIFSRAGDRLIVDAVDPRREDGRRIVAHDLREGTRAAIPPPEGGPLILSGDGAAITAANTRTAIKVHSTATGELLVAVDAPAMAVALAPDASFVAWIDPAASPMTVAHVFEVGSAAAPAELRIPGWPRGLAVSPDGEELLVITQEGITRWRGREGKAEPLDDRALVVANRIHYSADGRHLFFENYGRVDVHRSGPGAPRVASILPLLGGGVMIRGPAGEVDGSDDAAAGALTWVTGAEGDAMVAGGELGWDLFAEAGLYARLLAE